MGAGEWVKIAWVHDHLLEDIPDGGAQITNDRIINIGRERGHQMDLFTPKNLDTNVNNYEMAIVHNAKFFTHKQLLLLVRHPLVLKHEHDYWNLLDETQEGSKSEIWKNSKLGIFLSPGHKQAYVRTMPWLKVEPSIFSPSAIDVDLFQDKERHSEDIVVCVSSMSPHKGTANALEWTANHPEYKVHFYGRAAFQSYLTTIENLSNAEYKGLAPFENMSDIYNEAYGLLHMPQWMEPCGRSVIEARLCGCKMFINDRIGIATYPWWNESDKVFRENIRMAPTELWEKVEEVGLLQATTGRHN